MTALCLCWSLQLPSHNVGNTRRSHVLQENTGPLQVTLSFCQSSDSVLCHWLCNAIKILKQIKHWESDPEIIAISSQ